MDEDLFSSAINSVENETSNYVFSKDKNKYKLKKKDLCNYKSNTTQSDDKCDVDDDILALALEDVEKEAQNICEPALRNDKNEENVPAKKSNVLVGIDMCFDEDITDIPEVDNNVSKIVEVEKSVIHSGDTDSSDDEDNKYFEESRYDSYGKSIKQVLQSRDTHSLISRNQASSWKDKPISKNAFLAPEKTPVIKQTDALADPIFGIRIANPLLSSQSIKAKMYGRTAISFSKVKSHVEHGDLKSDWVIAGVVVKKYPARVSQNGSNYSNWLLSDLKGDMKTVLLFLFGRSHDELWKTPSGVVIAVLNPSVLSDKKSDYEAKLSIKSGDQVMIWGKSKDLGHCSFRKKNGEVCGSFVNIAECEFCVYHVKQEYKKYNSRSELQNGGNPKVNLRNKVLGKNEVFYGGKSFTALPIVGKKAHNPKDKERLIGLGQSSRPTITEEIKQIPQPQRSLGILNMLSSVNSNSSKKVSDKERLNALNQNSKPIPQPGNVKTKQLLTQKQNPSREKILLSNPGTDISFEIDVSSKSPSVSKSINKLPTSKAPNKLQKISNSKQKRFHNLLSLSSENYISKKQQSLSYPLPSDNNNPGIKQSASPVNILQNSGVVNDNKRSAAEPKEAQQEIKISSQTNNDKTPLISQQSFNSSPHPNESNLKEIKNSLSNCSSPRSSEHLIKRQTPVNTPPNAGMSKGKLKALQFVKNKGPISKDNPSGLRENKRGVKRPFPLEEDENSEENKKPVISERFLLLMNQKSIHEDLVELKEMEQEIEYFEKLEKKDRLEDKMLNTFKVDCKAVTCLKCNYTWFSASDACKAEGHQIKVVDAIKRFFKCGKCDNRTISLTIIPLIPCKKCFSTNWQRAPMIREKVAKGETLSIRGGEQQFFNSVITNSSLNLLVPD